MLSEERIKHYKALGSEYKIVEGIGILQTVQESTMERHTKIPIAGNTESHEDYNKLLRRISKHKQFDIPIPDELLAEFARVKNNVVPRIGKGLKCQKHGLESGATAGLSKSTQGRERLLGIRHTENYEMAIPRARKT